MNEKRKRVLVGGILAICLLSLVLRDDGDRLVGLTDMLTFLGVWSCAVWLWPVRAALALWEWRRLFAGFSAAIKKALQLLFWGAVILGLPAVAAAHYMEVDSKVILFLVLVSIGSWLALVMRYEASSNATDRDPNPAYPWNQPKRKNLILPGANPKMKELLEERNRRINRNQ